jgi:hypothetical protein
MSCYKPLATVPLTRVLLFIFLFVIFLVFLIFSELLLHLTSTITNHTAATEEPTTAFEEKSKTFANFDERELPVGKPILSTLNY